MATQTIEFRSPTGQTTTVKLFEIGSDTVVATASATEATNRKGTYAAAFTDVPAGTYQVIPFVGAIPTAERFVVLTLTTATFQATDTATVESAITTLRGADNDTLKSLSDQIDGAADRLGYLMAQEIGACADAGTSAESYTITVDTTTYTIDHTGLDATGNRGTATLTKS